MDRPGAIERKISFNPEAATFSPVANPAGPVEETVPTSGVTATAAHDSPFKPIAGLAEHHLVSANPALEAISVDDLVSMGVPVEALVKTFEQHSLGQVSTFIGWLLHDNATPTSVIGDPAPFQLQSSTFSPIATKPNYKSVDIDELSTSLGLPGAKMNDNAKGSPARFGNQQSRIVAEENQHMSRGLVATPQNVPRAVPSEYSHQHPRQLAVPISNYAHRPSDTRRVRSYTRTRRTDQGPEPSAADIYPDDAHWTPSQPAHRYQYPTPTYTHPAPHPVVRAEDATNWPTPAEVYDLKAKAPTTAHVSQIFDAKEPHVPPTAEDLAAADAAVLSLLNELPEPKINTLMAFGALDLLADERPLSPAQENGWRYGLNFHGLGLADPWQPPMAIETGPFRVRPRNHEGWGGWEWAMKNGWAMQ
ncbi:hypothetical protein IQ06DRAFT_284686 [Phaeosphaeriaceae sp. SRC1lsM3a]|nr:hypothetical protein IQ06DRAFT_284686 [Stagonospora sp. SRC1lsM3a]